MWITEEDEDILLLRIEDSFSEEGYVVPLDEETYLSLYNFLKTKIESKIN